MVEITEVFYGAYVDYEEQLLAKYGGAFKPEQIEILLPVEICVAVGRTIEIYNNQVAFVGNCDNFHFIWTCGVGKSYHSKFSILGKLADVGDYTLALSVYDNNMYLVASGSTTIRIVNIGALTGLPQRILPVGDSLLNKPWLKEVRDLAYAIASTEAIRFVGTLDYWDTTDPDKDYLKHEGRSGYRADQYIYAPNPYENPFWDAIDEEVDFAKYFLDNSIAEPDAFITMLGTNNVTDFDSLITFIDYILAQMPNKKIYVIIPQYPGGLLYDLQRKKLSYTFALETLSRLESYTDVHIIPLMWCHDSEHNYGEMVNVNPRNSMKQVYEIIGTVHPQDAGYMQFADVIFSVWAAHYND